MTSNVTTTSGPKHSFDIATKRNEVSTTMAIIHSLHSSSILASQYVTLEDIFPTDNLNDRKYWIGKKVISTSGLRVEFDMSEMVRH